ncbi:hypothetical protein [Paenibacillus elgii]|uniref:hypothetical protein n=1 Tax=Paenibacillus elgii TaxID=189691 RepID=UPI000248C5FA|nr:hypothetical protein [Paenibacillus elgii]
MRFVGIDPSTKTGFVVFDYSGELIRAKEITGVGDKDPLRMRTMIEDIVSQILPDDVICIEGFGFASQQAVQNGGIGWGIRMALDARGIKYHEAAPDQVKKFVGVSGWTGEKGSKRRLQGKEKKAAVKEGIRHHFGFFHKSDNINDAFILGRIAEALHKGMVQTKEQAEVIEAILSPKAPKTKKRKSKGAI